MTRAKDRPSSERRPASVLVGQEDGILRIALAGRLDSEAVAPVWPEAMAAFEGGRASCRRVAVDASAVTYCDGAGIGLLLELRRRALDARLDFEVTGLAENLRRVLELYPPEKLAAGPDEGRKRSVIEEIGVATVDVVVYIRDAIAFLGELGVEAVKVGLHPGRLRWRDLFLTVERAGADALPIIALLSFLFGLILAFQSAVPLQQYGAEIYVANLVALALVRELGPILTAVILAGRSGSAFAAELGTMKVNEEINALATMGISPVRFLALPRVLAGMAVTPLLVVFTNLVGIIGAALVIMTFGYPLVTVVDQVVSSVTYLDLLSGLGKATVFGLLVSAVGCMQGLATGRGASAVGESATRAVVAGIVLIIVADGLFAVMTYAVGL